jgi:Flp pilus assembly protein TadB
MKFDFILFAIPIVALICVFTFVSIAAWSDARRKEREAYYRSETLKKIAESGAGGQAALEYLREEERIADRRMERRAGEGRKLGGLVMVGVGAGLMLLLWGVTDSDARGVYLVGTIPFFIGVALLIYSYVLAPKKEE